MANQISAWINKETNEISYQNDEETLIENWQPIEFRLRKSFLQKSILEPLGLIAYSIIYAIFIYAFYENDPNVGDRLINALFFPLWPMILIAYKSLGDYFRAVLYSFLALMIIAELYQANEITIDGIVFIRFLIFIDNLLNIGIRADLISASPEQVLNLVAILFINIVIFEFILLVIHGIYMKYKGKTYAEFILSSKNLYLRHESKISKFDLVKQVFFMILFPFNIITISKVYKQIKYGILRKKEGYKYDFAKIGVESVEKISKKKEKKSKNIILGIIFILFGLLTIQIGLGLIIIILGLRFLFKKIKPEIDVSIRFSRKKVEGSFLLLSNDSILDLIGLKPEYAENFPVIE